MEQHAIPKTPSHVGLKTAQYFQGHASKSKISIGAQYEPPHLVKMQGPREKAANEDHVKEFRSILECCSAARTTQH